MGNLPKQLEIDLRGRGRFRTVRKRVSNAGDANEFVVSARGCVVVGVERVRNEQR